MSGGGSATVSMTLCTLLLILCSVVGSASAGLAEDCRGVISNDMSECLGYSTGKSDAPTDECCRSVTGVKDKQPKCLCYVVQLANSSEAFKDAGVQVQRILQLSSACSITGANISDCPKLLNLPAGDPRNALYNGSIHNSSPSKGSAFKNNDNGSGFRHHISHAGAVVSAVASAVSLSLF